jgi:diadenosine tetraphosphate (Ap4A) HIT family hydrolase
MASSSENPPAERLIVLQTDHWLLNHRADSALPGYLILGARAATTDLWQMPKGALAELGMLLARAQHALSAILQPEHLYIGRYGHTPGRALHFHLIPVCGWVKQSFFSDPRYRILQGLSEACSAQETDGAELTLYVWREFCESPSPPTISGPSVEEVIERLRAFMAEFEKS